MIFISERKLTSLPRPERFQCFNNVQFTYARSRTIHARMPFQLQENLHDENFSKNGRNVGEIVIFKNADFCKNKPQIIFYSFSVFLPSLFSIFIALILFCKISRWIYSPQGYKFYSPGTVNSIRFLFNKIRAIKMLRRDWPCV